MSTDKFEINWKSAGRTAQCKPNPKYPNGIAVDVAGSRKACAVSLTYPAPEVGSWFIKCAECGVSVAVTAAGRVDDPISVRIPCKEAPQPRGEKTT